MMKFSLELLLVLLSIVAIIIGSVVVDWIVVACIFVTCVKWGHKEKCILNPYYLFAVTPLSLLIYVNVSGMYMVDLTHRTWALAIINMVAFIIALRKAKGFTAWKTCKGPNEKNISIHTWLLLAIGLFSELFEYIAGSPFFLTSIVRLFSIPALICALKSKNKKLMICVLALLIGGGLSFLSKSTILTYIIAILIGLEKYYVHSRKQEKRVMVLSAIGILFMIFSFTFAVKGRDARSSDDTVDYYSTYGDVKWNQNTALFMPYMYLTTPWANLQYITETQDTRSYGLWLVKPVLGYLQLDENFRPFYSISAYSTFNTITFIATEFKDFGYWLSIISSILLGIFVKKIYTRYRGSQSPLDVACYVYVGIAVLVMFFSNHFFMQSYPFTIVIIMALYKLIFFPNAKPQLEY